MVPPETYVKVAGHLRSFQVKSEEIIIKIYLHEAISGIIPEFRILKIEPSLYVK